MRPTNRRHLLVLGILLLVSGFGTTKYAEARQEGLSQRTRDKAWRGEGGYVSGPTIYAAGILTMAAGAVLVVFMKD
jgi:hypothetical protein